MNYELEKYNRNTPYAHFAHKQNKKKTLLHAFHLYNIALFTKLFNRSSLSLNNLLHLLASGNIINKITISQNPKTAK